MKKILSVLFHRLTIVVFFILLQALVLVAVIWRFSEYFVTFYSLNVLLSIFVLIDLVTGKRNPAYKLAWAVPILVLPIFGTLIYLVFGHNAVDTRNRIRGKAVYSRMERANTTGAVLERLELEDRTAAIQARYINDHAWCPPFAGTETEYLPLGEVKLERLKQELEKAKRYIFLEYFIIEEGVMWSAILEILARKAAEGLDVRVVYDDIGCMFTLPYRYDRALEQMGIQCCVFNPFVPVLSSRFNNRDHRKIAVIDGYVAFTGGINLADEYINVREKHGHWKDSAVLLRGDGAWGFTVMFLALWDSMRGAEEDLESFRPDPTGYPPTSGSGCVQPFNDGPNDYEAVGENVYMHLITKAKHYIYINTPYLILDHEMTCALTLAAKSGVDVRITTPHIPDKWYVHAVTRANYEVLLEGGVKIYEYTPGFIHAKSFVVDDNYGVVGTVNLDYRSLYLHFECGVWLYRADCLTDLKQDYLETQELCTRITLEDCRRVAWYRKLGRKILSVFSPLM